MAAQRPVILETLRDLLEAEVLAVNSRVCFPWDAKLNPDDGSMLQVAMGESTVDNGDTIGMWLHRINIKIGAVVAGSFDYPEAWAILDDVAAAIAADYTLSGSCEYITVTGCGDSIDVAGDKIMWPHLAATIEYMTPRGAL